MTTNQLMPSRLRTVLSWLALSVAVCAIAPRAFAQANANPPERLAYQGFAVDANGIPLATNAPKNYDVIFRIWNDPVATAAANRLWTEQQTVTIDKGYFSVILGEGTVYASEPRPLLLSSVFTNTTASDRWVSLTVRRIGPSSSDVDILPRLRLITSPYAFLASKAITVDGAGVTSGTVSDTRLSTNVALRSGGNTFSGTQTFTGTQIINNNVGIGTATPDRPLTIRASGAPNGEWLSLKDTGDITRWHLNNEAGGLDFVQSAVADARLFLATNGNTGIGTSSPQAKLHVAGGNLQLDNNSRLHFADGGEIRSFDTNHSIRFRRSENKMELLEYGDLIFSSGATGGLTTASAVLLANGNFGVGTAAPAAKLHVAGAGNFLGSVPYVRISDQKPKGTHGGASVAGINVKTFNTEYDPQNIATTNSNTNIVLQAGTYQCLIRSPAFRCNQNQARLRVSGGATILYGTSHYTDTADGGDVSHSIITGQFTLTGQTTLVIEHYFTSAKSPDGLGNAVNANWTDAGAVEVYTVAEFWKLQ